MKSTKKRIYVYFFIFYLLIISLNFICSTQAFLTRNDFNLTTLKYSAITFGDINNDNRIDLIMDGKSEIVGGAVYKINIYINNGTSFIEDSTWEQNLTSLGIGSLTLGDVNNDGKLDLVSAGCGSGGDFVDGCDNGAIRIFIYINNGTSFIEDSTWEQNLTAVYRSSLTFGDINNDGKLDLALCGDSGSSKNLKIYINNGVTLIESSQWEANLTGISRCSLVFGDFDKDSDNDLIISGRDNSDNKLTKTYLNNGTSFIESSQWQNNLVNVDDSSLALADFDNDGDLDLSLTGCCDKHRIYRNNGTSFVEIDREITGGLTGVFAGSQAFGDYNCDGYLDLITIGREQYTTLYLYNSTSTNFTTNTNDPESHILDLDYSSIAWIDFDNDLDLDLIQTGYGTEGGGTGNATTKAFVYLSNRSLTKNNTKPISPTTNFSSNYSITNNTLALGWGNGSDNETPSTGLYYNLMVGNSTTNNTIVSGVFGGSSNPTAGYFGNMMQRKNITLNLILAEGTYYWYVQTIDTGLAKSNWSARQSISVSADTTPPNISGISSSVTSSSATITWNTDEMANSTVYYGTTVSLGSSSSDASWTMSHPISLSSLSASTTYYYNVSSCDDSGNCNTSLQYTFTTSAAETPPAGGGSPSGGGGIITPTVNKTIPKFDIDFSNTSAGTLEARQGDIKTFSFNNEIKHSITLITVAIDSITLLITSEPITIQIRIGEVKEIDINGDNINDLEVKLISIISGKASFLLNKLSGAGIVAKEELGKEALFDVKVLIVNLFKIVKSGREVIAQIEVFNVNNIGQVDVVADYYITSKEDNKTKLAEGSDTLAVEAVSSFVRSLKVPYNLKSGNYLFNIDVKYKDEIMASGNAEFTIIKNYEIIIAVGIAVFIITSLFAYLQLIRRKEKKIEEEEKKLKKEIKRILKEKESKKRGNKEKEK